MAVTAVINQYTQLSQESAFLAGSAATRNVQSINFTPTAKQANVEFTPMGHRHTTELAVEKAYAAFAIDAPIALFSESLWLYEALYGTVSATVPGGGTLTKQRVYTPPLTGSITPKSLIIQQGDATNVNVYTGLVMDGFTKKWSKDGISCTGTGFGATGTTGGTFTASPTTLKSALQTGIQLNVYLDGTSAGLGTTQLTETFLDAQFDVKNLRTPFFDANRASKTIVDYVDGKPTHEIKMTLIENATTRAIVAQPGVLQYLRLNVQGALIETALYYLDQWDLAVSLKGDVAYTANGDIWARTLTFDVMEDPTWGKAYVITNQTQETTIN